MTDDNKRDDGGPAFPTDVSIGPAGDVWTGEHNGMTLRDWFAGQALSGLAGAMLTVSKESLDRAAANAGYFGPLSGYTASEAYALADAMLAARSK